MEFEWDSTKADRNLRKHGIDFPGAAKVFQDGRLLIKVDRRFEEERFRAIGAVNSVILSVAYTMRGATCRIINARRASRHERKQYGSLSTGS